MERMGGLEQAGFGEGCPFTGRSTLHISMVASTIALEHHTDGANLLLAVEGWAIMA